MNLQMSDIIEALNDLMNNNRAIIDNRDVKAVEAVLDEVGYVYRANPTNHIFTEISIRD